MAENRSTEETSEDVANGASRMGTAVMSATQDAADVARATAQKAAERLPDAVAGVQTAANETQRRLGEMDNDALLVGTSFSLGLAVGLFLSGANRFLVAAALAPAAAMLLTFFGRDQQSATAAATGSRRSTRTSPAGE